MKGSNRWWRSPSAWFLLAAVLGSCRQPPAVSAGRSDSAPAAPPAAAAADTGEGGALAGSDGAVRRDGLDLRIATGSGSFTLTNDSSDQSDAYRIYRYLGRLAGTRFHAVHVSFFESSAVLLVHEATGRRVELAALPVVSPGGEYLAVGHFDLEAQMSPNVLSIVSPSGDSVLTRFAVEPTDWGPDSLRWQGRDTLAVLRLVATNRGPGEYDRRWARLIRRNSTWAFDDGLGR